MHNKAETKLHNTMSEIAINMLQLTYTIRVCLWGLTTHGYLLYIPLCPADKRVCANPMRHNMATDNVLKINPVARFV